ncbi:MAG: ferrous iron transport protein B [Candidatus Krumholzibacteriia bacterium]
MTIASRTGQDTLTVALAGNPNAGKTTLFNQITGARQRVGNYPGVTVEWKEGHARRGGTRLRVVDLPGTYSLSAYTDEERVARNYLLDERPDVVVDVVDASNLDRNLYLTTELLELGLPLVIVLNMSDAAAANGLEIDTAALSRRLGAPVVSTVGHRGRGLDALLDAVVAVGTSPNGHGRMRVDFGGPVEDEIRRMQEVIGRDSLVRDPRDLRWLAIKLLEKDREYLAQVESHLVRAEVSAAVQRFAGAAASKPDVVMARHRCAFVDDLVRASVRRTRERGVSVSDRVDDVVMHPVWGLPLFAGLMYAVFTLTFTLGNPPMTAIESFFGWLAEAVVGLWPAGHESALKSLVVDGIIGGVGGVIVFLPNIVLLFLAIAVLEGTGYMARAAFVMDRFMSKVGLHGKSFIPLLIGFGCTVPAIMATRTLESRRDRITTMLVLPLMSCGARLPIYALIIPAFFPQQWQGPVLWLIYFIGIVLALVGARLLRATVFRGDTTPFVMELPPFRIPTARDLALQAWTRAWLYLRKAGTVILGVAIILWFLTSYPKPPAGYEPPEGFDEPVAAQSALPTLAEFEDGTSAVTATGGELLPADRQRAAELSYSVAGRIGRFMEPLLHPMGFDWRVGTALVGAFAAKEVFVAQMGIVFAVGDADEASEGLRAQLRSRYTPLQAFCIMLFALIATPCMATVAVTRQESGSWGWALAQFWGLTLAAWVLTTLVYQAGRLMLG